LIVVAKCDKTLHDTPTSDQGDLVLVTLYT
jgi:hypothetical protein